MAFARIDRIANRESLGNRAFWQRASEIFRGTGEDGKRYRDADRKPRGPLSYEEWDAFFELARDAGVFDIVTNEKGEHLRFAGPMGLALARLHAAIQTARDVDMDPAEFWRIYDNDVDREIARGREASMRSAREAAARFQSAARDRKGAREQRRRSADDDGESF